MNLNTEYLTLECLVSILALPHPIQVPGIVHTGEKQVVVLVFRSTPVEDVD